jgi:hypothetical protein
VAILQLFEVFCACDIQVMIDVHSLAAGLWEDWHDLGISEKSENRTLEKLMMEDSRLL